MARQYQTRPEVVEAVQWSGGNTHQVEQFIGRELEAGGDEIGQPWLTIPVDFGDGPTVDATPGDWVVRLKSGWVRVMGDDQFGVTFESVRQKREVAQAEA